MCLGIEQSVLMHFVLRMLVLVHPRSLRGSILLLPRTGYVEPEALLDSVKTNELHNRFSEEIV